MMNARSLTLSTSFLLLLVIGTGCGEDLGPAVPPSELNLKLFALGDSYTVGQSVPVEWSWPNQLADSLEAIGASLDPWR